MVIVVANILEISVLRNAMSRRLRYAIENRYYESRNRFNSFTTMSYAFGNEIDTNLANYWATEDDNAILATKPVGSYYPNAFGLYDMHGNVYELCYDAWHNNYEGAPNDGTAWANGNESQLVVIRGGSFDYYEDKCRSAYRNETPNYYRYHGTGFRIACSI